MALSLVGCSHYVLGRSLDLPTGESVACFARRDCTTVWRDLQTG